jgi:hypothetical protein
MISMIKYVFVAVVLALMLLNSCIKNNPDPAWIEVNEWTLATNPNSQYPTGELTHNFTDAWVYVNDEVVGVFELPFKIPILKSGLVNIKIYPTVRNNGISASKKIYPFVDVYELNAELIQNQVLTINPVTKYKEAVQFWLEEFEDAAIKIQDDPVSLANLSKGNDPSILQWGNFYGRVDLNSLDSTWSAYSDNMVLPKGQEVYLEIDYYNTNSLITGLIWISSSSIINNPHILLNSQDPAQVKWKKMYIDLRELVSNSQGAEYFKQSFETKLNAGMSSSFIVMDNIKVVHF